MSGPEVIETANGVEEFDSRDRALVWRSTGGKHRYLMGDCQRIVADDIAAFRGAALDAVSALTGATVELTLEALEAEQQMLEQRIARFGTLPDPVDIWSAMQIANAANIPMLDVDSFIAAADPRRMGV
jgi:malonate decarboxylase beta subunit